MPGTYATYKTDQSKEKTGVVIDLGESGKFTVARAGGANKDWSKKIASATKPVRRQIQAETIDSALVDKIVIEAFVDTVLKDWSGVTGREGAPLAFTRDNAIALFTDLPDLFQELNKVANDAATFRDVILEVDSKNSATA